MKLIRILKELRLKYCLSHSYVRVCRNSQLTIGKGCLVKHCNIRVGDKSKLIIKDNARLENVSIYIENGTFHIGASSWLSGKRYDKSQYIINNGDVTINHHSKSMVKRLWVRFGGKVGIGCYTNINAGTEIRSDEAVHIGDFCQISYNVRIWDTNTHCLYSSAKRREIAKKYWPYYGFETERPKTSPITIGNDCWIGEDASILKGSIIGDEVTVGYRTTVAGKYIPPQSTVVQVIDYKIIQR